MNRLILGVFCLLGAALILPLLAAEGTRYGKGVSLAAPTPIEKLLAEPQAYSGKTVRIDGVVTAVCDKAGCWMELSEVKSGSKGAPSLRCKVRDGAIVFPVAAKGKKASAEGVFEPVSPEMAREYAADQEEATGGDLKRPVPVFQLQTAGAVIY